MRRARRDDGVTIVEASFVLPLLFLFVFGLVDVGMWTFNANQATNAARDGARAGIFSYVYADEQGSADHDTIVAAVQDRLPDATVGADDITVTCNADGSPVDCESAEPGDEVHVEVEWVWDLVTPVAAVIGVHEGAAKGSATMAIVGLPVAGGAIPDEEHDDDGPDEEDDGEDSGALEEPLAACTVDESSITTPLAVATHGNQLTADLVVTFTSNGSPACADLRIELVGTRTTPSVKTLSYDCACGTGPTHTWTYRGSDNIWQNTGSGTFRVLDGSTVLATHVFPLS